MTLERLDLQALSEVRRREASESYSAVCDTLVDGRPCGKPGHLHSGPGPVTFVYCDEHPPGTFLHFGFLILVVLILAGAGGGALWWLL